MTYKDYLDLEEFGYLKLPFTFDLTDQEEELERLSKIYHDSVYRENGDAIRHMQAIHEERSPAYSPFFKKYSEDERVLKFARTFLNSERIYIHQSKINYKKAGKGLAWNWHQDYASYKPKDFLPDNIPITLVVLLDDVDDNNGPLIVVPKTHHEILDSYYDERSAYPLLCTKDEIVTEQVKKNGTVSFVGKKGEAYLFHSCILHSSLDNNSDRDRKQLYFTYNTFENRPYKSEGRRNWWNSAHDWSWI